MQVTSRADIAAVHGTRSNHGTGLQASSGVSGFAALLAAVLSASGSPGASGHSGIRFTAPEAAQALLGLTTERQTALPAGAAAADAAADGSPEAHATEHAGGAAGASAAMAPDRLVSVRSSSPPEQEGDQIQRSVAAVVPGPTLPVLETLPGGFVESVAVDAALSQEATVAVAVPGARNAQPSAGPRVAMSATSVGDLPEPAPAATGRNGPMGGSQLPFAPPGTRTTGSPAPPTVPVGPPDFSRPDYEQPSLGRSALESPRSARLIGLRPKPVLASANASDSSVGSADPVLTGGAANGVVRAEPEPGAGAVRAAGVHAQPDADQHRLMSPGPARWSTDDVVRKWAEPGSPSIARVGEATGEERLGMSEASRNSGPPSRTATATITIPLPERIAVQAGSLPPDGQHPVHSAAWSNRTAQDSTGGSVGAVDADLVAATQKPGQDQSLRPGTDRARGHIVALAGGPEQRSLEAGADRLHRRGVGEAIPGRACPGPGGLGNHADVAVAVDVRPPMVRAPQGRTHGRPQAQLGAVDRASTVVVRPAIDFSVRSSESVEAAVVEVPIQPMAEGAVVGERVGATASTLSGAVITVQVLEGLSYAIRSGGQRVRIRLHPPELGTVDLEVRQRQEAVSARLVVERGEVAEVLRAAAPQLQEMLESRGLSLARFEVAVRSDAQDGRSHDGGHRDPQQGTHTARAVRQGSQAGATNYGDSGGVGPHSRLDVRV